MNREDVLRMARKVGYPIHHPEWQKATEEFAALVAAAAKAEENEACAKVCEQEWNKYCVEPSGYALAVNECAAAIRARGETK